MKQNLPLLKYGQTEEWDVSYAVQAIQKLIRPSFPRRDIRLRTDQKEIAEMPDLIFELVSK